MPQESNLIALKKGSLTKDIIKLLGQYKIPILQDKLKRIDSFLEDILMNKYEEKPYRSEMLNFTTSKSTQTDPEIFIKDNQT